MQGVHVFQYLVSVKKEYVIQKQDSHKGKVFFYDISFVQETFSYFHSILFFTLYMLLGRRVFIILFLKLNIYKSLPIYSDTLFVKKMGWAGRSHL